MPALQLIPAECLRLLVDSGGKHEKDASTRHPVQQYNTVTPSRTRFPRQKLSFQPLIHSIILFFSSLQYQPVVAPSDENLDWAVEQLAATDKALQVPRTPFAFPLFTCPVAVIKKVFCLVLFFFLSSSFLLHPSLCASNINIPRVHHRFPTSTLEHLSTRLGISTSSRISFVSTRSLFDSRAIGLGLVNVTDRRPSLGSPFTLHHASPTDQHHLDNPSSFPFLFLFSQKLLVIAAHHLLIHFANRFLPPSRWLSSRSRPSPALWLSSVLSPPVLSPMSFLSFPRLPCVCSHLREAPSAFADLCPAAQTTTYQPVTQQHGVATADGT